MASAGFKVADANGRIAHGNGQHFWRLPVIVYATVLHAERCKNETLDGITKALTKREICAATCFIRQEVMRWQTKL
jgi:hypothetical protein